MKVDCLALGMLSCMKRGFDLLAEHKGISLDLATIPAEDPRDCTLEPMDEGDRFAVRLGMSMVKGLANTYAAKIVGVRADQPFVSVDDGHQCWHVAHAPVRDLYRGIHVLPADFCELCPMSAQDPNCAPLWAEYPSLSH
jgi:DNA polymerase III alpha subunit